MSLSKMEVQRIMERLGRLENQVASLNFKLQAMENLLKPENLAKRVREGEEAEKRKAETQLNVSTDLLKGANEK
jgi:hypothetical protein